MRQPNQPISYEAIVTTELCLIAITGLALGKLNVCLRPFLRRLFSSSSSFILAINDAFLPPYFARHLKNDALLIPYSRQSSEMGTPLSACLMMASI